MRCSDEITSQIRRFNSRPLLSIIVPIYKVEDYLRECIDSVLSQHYNDYEIILVDDGSPDECPNICDEYSRKYNFIKVIHKKNGGLSDARNAGILRAEGEYLLFLDSDDMLLENSLPEIGKVLSKVSPNVLIGKFLASDPPTGASSIDHLDFAPMTFHDLDLVKKYLFENNFHFVWTAWRNIVQRSFLLEKKLFFMKGIFHEDEEWTPRLYWLAETFYYVEKPFYYYRLRREGSITSTIQYRHVKDMCLVLESLEHFMTQYPDSRAYMTKRLLVLARGIHRKICFLSNEEISEFFSEFRNKPVFNVIKQVFFFPFLSWVLNTEKHLIFERCLRKAKYLGGQKLLSLLSMRLKSKLYSFWRRRLFKISVRAGRRKRDKFIFLIATPLHSNLGDHAIACAERRFFKDYFPLCRIREIPGNDIIDHMAFYRELVIPEDLLCVTGGGFLGTLWIDEENKIRKTIKTFPNNPIAILPQTVYYDNISEGKTLKISQEIYQKHSRLIICAREKASYEYLKRHFDRISIYLAPDMALYTMLDLPKNSRNGVALCFRNDKESVLSHAEKKRISSIISRCCPSDSVSIIDTMADKAVGLSERYIALGSKWQEFSFHKLVVTDRLHGMLFAVITGTPVVAMNNLSKKPEGVYEWVKDLEYVRFIDSADKLESAVRSLNLHKEYAYSNEPLIKHFDVLAQVIRDGAGWMGKK